MNKIQLFFLLRKNTKLSEKRHPMFEANQYGKLIGYIVISILAIEFLALGTFFGWLAAKEDVPEMIFYIMPLFLIFDFSGRFATQQTPLMLVKPYLLTPISKFTAVECFLVSQVLDLGNLLWMVTFLPYVFVVWCGGLSGWAAIGMLFLLHLMIVVNSQWYLLVRTLVNHNIFWWALPIVFYGALIGPFIFWTMTRLMFSQMVSLTLCSRMVVYGLSSSYLRHSLLSYSASTEDCRCNSSMTRSLRKRIQSLNMFLSSRP